MSACININITYRQTLLCSNYSGTLIYTYIHSNRVGIYADGITNSLHIMASITSTYARCVNLNIYANYDFLLLVSIIFIIFIDVSGVCSCE